jgi:hypothetical protein
MDFLHGWKLMLRDEPDQVMGNRTTDFNPDWIGMIMLLILEPVKIAVWFTSAGAVPSKM